jgi:hypothetical protein
VGRLLVVLLASLGLLSGCRSPAPRSPEVVRQKAAEQAAKPPEPSIFDRLHLGPAERAVVSEALTSVQHDLIPYDRARLELLAEVVLQIRAGAFDRQKLDPLIERAIVEYERVTPRLILFANDVHRTLSPAQRRELVALWDEDDEKLSDEERQAKEREELTKVIDLTGAQRTRLVTPLLGVYLEYYGPIGDFRKYWSEAKVAFVGSAFDAAKLPFFTSLPLRTLARAVFDASETVLGVLDANQRETLAVTIETQWRD